MGFTKLDEGIIFSSVMLEPPDVFKVWITMLAMCKGDGICRASSVGISAVSRLDLDVVERAIVILESPDKRSRSTNDDGRRIRRIDGGYEIINYMKYRELSTSEAEAKRKWEKRHCPDLSGHIRKTPDSSASTSASASASTSASSVDVQLPRSPAADVIRAQMSSHLRRVAEAYPLKSAFKASTYEWAQTTAGMSFEQEAEFADKCIAAITRQSKGDRWKDKQYIPELRNWLRDGRWDDAPIKKDDPLARRANKYLREHPEDRPEGWVDQYEGE